MPASPHEIPSAQKDPVLFSVIIINWNSRNYVRECLRSLYRYIPKGNWELLVADNGSYDGCEKMLSSEFPEVRFIQIEKNLGFAKANNLAASHARGEYLLLLNPDTLLTTNFIHPLITEARTVPVTGLFGCRILNTDSTLQDSCVQAYPTPLNQAVDSAFLRRLFPNSWLWGNSALFSNQPGPIRVQAVSGACMLLPKNIFLSVGGFTETYFMYVEDIDLCYKINSAGYYIYYCSSATVIHIGGGSSRKAPSMFSVTMLHQSLYDYFKLRHGLVTAAAYRFAMLISACLRIIIMAPLLMFGNRILQHGLGTFPKWLHVIRWCLGLTRRRI